MVSSIKYFLSFFLITLSLFAQSNKDIEQKSSELKGLKYKISKLENELKEKTADEVKNINLLDKINHQAHLLNRVIKRLNVEESKIQKNINSLTSQIERIESNINELKEVYKKYVKWLYVNGNKSKWSYLLGANSVNQAIKRYKYFDYITKKNEKELGELVTHKKNLEKLRANLKTKKAAKSNIEKEKLKEINRLISRKKEKNRLIVRLNKDQRNIKDEIDEKRKYEIEIKLRIASLIEESRKKELNFRKKKFENKSVVPIVPKVNYAKFEKFSQLKGRMAWPVSSGKVIRKFGENKNKKLKTITLNYGIDIKSNPSEKVYAVAEGIISVIDWIVGFGSIIIVTHNGKFRTVYGHIDEIQVNEGDIVKAGTLLGIVNQSLEGNIVHFEIWDERNYKNPRKWLVKK